MAKILFAAFILGVFLSIGLANENSFKLCATEKHAWKCPQVQRGNSEVDCQWVQDSVECAKRLINGTADFGVFSAESTLHLSVLGWNGLTVVKQLRHSERQNVLHDFESVVVVRKDLQGGLQGLSGKQFCHPGYHYDSKQRWTERFLKHFERKVAPLECEADKSPAELEVASLSKYFGNSCRPGTWSHDTQEDAALKMKYSSLCALCDSHCNYDENSSTSGPDRHHQSALNCLRKGGDVAYVSREDAEYFFNKEGLTNDFRYLCPNGTMQSTLNNKEPCLWLRQPWKVIIARADKSVAVEKKLNNWLNAAKSSSSVWEKALAEIIEADSYTTYNLTLQRPSEYIREFREIPLPDQYCNSEISWCTTEYEELEKCQVSRAGGISTGVLPIINCNPPLGNVVNCLEDISRSNSEFMGIDSNFGYLARKKYNLTAALYYETVTENKQYTDIVVVVHDNSKYKRFEDLKKAEACIPEFGSTPSIEFINLGKRKKFFKKSECRYGKLLEDFFGDSCVPGALDIKHSFTNDNSSTTLCNLCTRTPLKRPGLETTLSTEESNKSPAEVASCSAEESNRYYDNRGALKCLQEQGDVAILELNSLKEDARNLSLDENSFRVICRNGSRASYTGFDVDSNCVLTSIVDGEVVTRRGTSKTKSIVNTLRALDTYFQNDPDFKMFNIYNGERHLLFKDSTVGLTAANEENQGEKVANYVELFKGIEACVQGSGHKTAAFSVFTAVLVAVLVKVLSY